MRLIWSIACNVFIISIFNGDPVIASRIAVLRRQDGQSAPSLSASSNPAAIPSSARSAATSLNNGASSTANSVGSGVPSSRSSALSDNLHTPSSADSTVKATSRMTAASRASTSTPSTSMGTSVNGASVQPGNASTPVQLPLQPKITPALAVAGVILVLSGAIYSLIGIKNKCLHISLSAAFLASLSVTVLIVYVSNPPVSNAVQGAYFVAVFITGVILGAASLVFVEVTEGLGCLLGGFCISMWFLVLKQGGLITSTTGKAVFIAAFCLAAYALSFNGYTRSYGLIGGTSFAGATAVVIGIDCYSRAGLKEFWMYLWALNGNVFPLGTTTYPITRGIRVEIACIILLFVVGIMSQLKIWKVIKEGRDRKTAKLQDEEQRREQNEEELGRRVEDISNRERAQWEAAYGDKEQPLIQHVDSGIGSEELGSTGKGSTSIIETRRLAGPSDQAMEMENLDLGIRNKGDGSISKIGDKVQDDRRRTITLGQEDDVDIGAVHPGNFAATALKGGFSPESISVSDLDDLPDATERTALALRDDHEDESAWPLPTNTVRAVSASPQITPLPFRVPSLDSDEDASSMAVSVASENFPTRVSKRLSGASLFKPLSKQSRHFIIAPCSEEALAVLQEDSDRKYSLAVGTTVNELSSNPKERRNSTEERGKARISIRRKPVPSASSRSHYSLLTGKAVYAQTQRQSDEDMQSLNPTKSVVASEASSKRPPCTSLSEHLPRGGSPLITTYRTNEWAKHLDRAERPGLDELEPAGSALGSVTMHVEEDPRPVDVEGLQQTAGIARSARKSPLSRLSGGSQQPSTGGRPLMMSKDSLPNLHRRQVNADPSVSAYSQSLARTPSQTSLQSLPTSSYLPHQASMTSAIQAPSMLATRTLRGTSAQLTGQALVESPIEEGVESSFPPRFTAPMPNNTLIAKRDTMIRNKHSFMSLAHPPLSAADYTAEMMPNDSASTPSNRASSLDDDSISLSQRRSLLRQGKRHTSLPQTQTSSPYDFPQHPRSASAVTDLERRDLILASWRSAVKQELNSDTIPQIQSEIDARRTEMMNERYQSGLNRQQRAMTASYRESIIDQAMRRGDMLDLHREAMRKMQAAANKNV